MRFSSRPRPLFPLRGPSGPTRSLADVHRQWTPSCGVVVGCVREPKARRRGAANGHASLFDERTRDVDAGTLGRGRRCWTAGVGGFWSLWVLVVVPGPQRARGVGTASHRHEFPLPERPEAIAVRVRMTRGQECRLPSLTPKADGSSVTSLRIGHRDHRDPATTHVPSGTVKEVRLEAFALLLRRRGQTPRAKCREATDVSQRTIEETLARRPLRREVLARGRTPCTTDVHRGPFAKRRRPPTFAGCIRPIVGGRPVAASKSPGHR